MAWSRLYIYFVGGVHGVAQVIENHLRSKRTPKRSLKGLRVVLVFLFCSFAWIFFRAETIFDVRYIILNMFSNIFSPISYIKNGLREIGIVTVNEMVKICVLVGYVFAYDFCALKMDVWDVIGKKH